MSRALEQDRARVGVEHARHDVEHRGLAGAVGPDDREHLALLDREGRGRRWRCTPPKRRRQLRPMATSEGLTGSAPISCTSSPAGRCRGGRAESSRRSALNLSQRPLSPPGSNSTNTPAPGRRRRSRARTGCAMRARAAAASAREIAAAADRSGSRRRSRRASCRGRRSHHQHQLHRQHAAERFRASGTAGGAPAARRQGRARRRDDEGPDLVARHGRCRALYGGGLRIAHADECAAGATSACRLIEAEQHQREHRRGTGSRRPRAAERPAEQRRVRHAMPV